jgi:nucleoside phosphorylase
MIGIIGAMGVEVEGIQARIEQPETRVICGNEFTSGKLCGRDVVIAKCGIGKVNAAICTQTMILTYAPEIIVNSGVAGSLTRSLTFGDIAIASNLVQHDVDTSALGDPVGLVSTINKIYFECDERAVSLIHEIVSGMEGVGDVTGDISFLLSRLSADGHPLDTAQALEIYCRHASIPDPAPLDSQMRLANLNTTFLFWHMYLHGSPEDRVRQLFDHMVEDMRVLLDR